MDQPLEHYNSIWNGVRFPMLSLGFTSVPAFILPCVAAFVFVFIKTYPREIFAAWPLRVQDVRRPQEDEQRRQNEGPLPGGAPQLDHFVATSLDLFSYLTAVIMSSKGQVHWNAPDFTLVVSLSQTLALLLGGVIFHHSPSLPCYLASAGWALFHFRRHSSDLDRYLVALLAIPCSWQIFGNTKRVAWISGTLLLILAVDGILPPTSILRSNKVTSTIPDWHGVIWILCAFAADFAHRQRDPTYIGRSLLRDLIGGTGDVVKLLLVIAASICITGYGFSCLNWRFLLLGLPSRAPAVDAAAIAAGYMMFIPMIILGRMRPAGQRRQRIIDAADGDRSARSWPLFLDCIGWTITFYAGLWAALTARAHGHR